MFIVLCALPAVYFSGVMVRLVLTLTPCVCILAAIAFSQLFDLYLREEDSEGGGASTNNRSATETGDKNGRLYDKVGKIRKIKHDRLGGDCSDEGLGGNVRSIVIMAVLMMLMMCAQIVQTRRWPQHS